MQYGCGNKNITLVFKDDDELELNVKEDKTSLDLKDKIQITPPTNHNELNNLDYENSGHIGFASEKNLNILSNKTKELELSIIDNNNKIKKIEEDIKELSILSKKINDEKVPYRLDSLSISNLNKDRSKMSIYVDDDGVNTKISIDKLLDCKIRTVNNIPNDMQKNDYILLEIKDN